MGMKGLAAIALLLSICSPIDAACLNPLGCQQTLDECLADASKRPSDAGVNLAMRQCHLKDQEQRDAVALDAWPRVAPTGDIDAISAATKLTIHSVATEQACSGIARGPGSDRACTHIRWRLVSKNRFLHLILKTSTGAYDWHSPEPLKDFPEMPWALRER